MASAPQKKLFPYNSHGEFNGIVAKVVEAHSQLMKRYRQGYVAPLNRAGPRKEMSTMTSKLERLFSEQGISHQNIKDALKRTIVLNPNMKISNGSFHLNGSNEGEIVSYFIGPYPDWYDTSSMSTWSVKVEQKRYLMESLIKAIIGETDTLKRSDFDRVAISLNKPELFFDNRGYDPGHILTPLEQHEALEFGDRPGSCWRSDINYIPSMASQRRYVVEANQNYFRRILKSFAVSSSEGESLEVCCGWGDFREMIPEDLWHPTIHMDWNPVFTDNILENSPDAHVRQGNVYSIPYKDERFKNVFGLTPFVSLWFLDYAIAEIHRVLQRGGRFFAFQDLLPNDCQMAEQLIKRGLTSYANRSYSIGEIDDPVFWEMLEKHFQDQLPIDTPGWCQYMKKFNQVMVMQNCYEYLEAWLTNELKFAGFNILYAAPERVFNVEQRQIQHVDIDQSGHVINPNIAYRSNGSGRGPIVAGVTLPEITNSDVKRAIGSNHVLQSSTVWAVIAGKRSR